MDRLRQAIGRLREQYQPVYVGDDLISDGIRPGSWERLEVICGMIDRDDPVILDIGSNCGFFAVQLARRYPKALIISVEQSKYLCSVQRELLKLHCINNVVVIEALATPGWFEAIAKCCGYFDLTICLSVLHHMPDPGPLMRAIWAVSRNIIIETPDMSGDGCGKPVIEKHLLPPQITANLSVLQKHPYVYDPPAETPAQKERCTHAKRDWYFAKRTEYSREALASCIHSLRLRDHPIHAPHLQQRSYRISYDPWGWEIRKQDRQEAIRPVAGFNITDLYHLGPIWWPDRVDLIVSAVQQIDLLMAASDHIKDVRPHNLIITADLLKSIDNQRGPFHLQKYDDLSTIVRFIDLVTISPTVDPLTL